MNEINKISKSPLFLNLSIPEIEEVLFTIEHSIEYFDKNDMLTMQGEVCNRLIILVEGSVKGEMIDPAGKVVKVEDIFAPNPLAILFLFGKDNRFPVQVTAREPVVSLVLPKASVLKMLHSNEQILTNYLNVSAQYARMLSRKLHFMSFRTIRQKLTMYFLDLTKENENVANLQLTQTALAEYFGVSRPSLARELASMQQEGLILLEKRQVTILDRNKLIRLVSF